jgi:hypothetical protein
MLSLGPPPPGRSRWPALLLAVAVLPATAAGTEPNTPGLVRLSLEPADVVLSGAGARQQLLVTGYYADGSVRDLTGAATFTTDRPDRVSLHQGAVHAGADGEALVSAHVADRDAVLRVRVRDFGRVRPLSFRNDVMAVLSKAGCNAGTCHGNFNGKNGFRLSLRGEDSAFDLDSLARDTQGRRVCPLDPAASLVLRKPTGQVPHEGGVRFARESHEYNTLRRWIAEGLRPDPPDAPRLTRLEVLPRQRVLLHGETRQQLVARASFSDGTVRDVTDQAVYEPSADTVRVSPQGLVTADKAGEVTLVVRYLDRRVPCRLAFVPERPGFRWQPVPVNNYIDEHVFARLRVLQVQPSDLADDAAFLRRAYLDVCGVLPTPAEVRAFLADADPHRRARLVDRLLERPEYADYWSLKWADLLRNEEKAVDARGVRHFQRWLRQNVAADKPLDEFARELLTARGSTYEHPEANYYRTNLEPQKAAETTAQLFLGVRLACARCHNHPFDRWTQDDYYGLSAFFARLRTRMVDNKRTDKFDKHELRGDMIVYLDRTGEVRHPRTGAAMPPRVPDGKLPPGADGDRPAALARWLTAPDNPYFGRVMANRIWYHLLGRGVVEPVDDFRESNPPVSEPLLDALARDLAGHRFSQKHLIRTILASRTYQLSSRPTPSNRDDEAGFSHVQPRLLPAEALLDAVSQVTGVPERFAGFPAGTRAAQLPGVAGAPGFLKVFGRPDRLLACECERQNGTTLGQAFQMITGETITRKVAQSPVVAELLLRHASDEEIVTELYLAALSRYPTPRELHAITPRLAAAADRRRAVEDLLWAVLNTKEFLLRR